MCLSPTTMMQAGKLVTFSCGRCYECIRKRKLEWVIRLHAEMSVSDCAFFSLISYNDDNYPPDSKYDVHAIQNLIKNLRVRLNRKFRMFAKDIRKPIELKYFIVSELGETLNRLHYHAIFFLKNANEHDFTFLFWKSLLEETWGKGFCSAFCLGHKTICYTTKYLQKQYNMMLYSKSLGKDAYFAVQRSKELNFDEFDEYPINGKSHIAPRSWRNELRGQQHNTIASSALKSKMEHIPSLLSFRDKIVINNHFHDENPRVSKEKLPRLDNSDLINFNGEF